MVQTIVPYNADKFALVRLRHPTLCGMFTLYVACMPGAA